MSNTSEQSPQPNANAYLHAEYWGGAMLRPATDRM
jgi:hypothetical protein